MNAVNTKVAIVGSNGQLGASLRRAFAGREVAAFDHARLDIVDPAAVRKELKDAGAGLVVNAAAFRRPDDCEEDPGRAFAVNALGARNLALACADLNAVLVHISTDNVFDGKKGSPYLEDDPTNPINAYGLSKLAGEYFVRSIAPRHFIVRTSALFGEGSLQGPATNFVLRMIQRAKEPGEILVVDDQRTNPTYTRDVADKIAWLSGTEAFGTYHVANSGDCSWYELARAVLERAGGADRLRPVPSHKRPTRAPRVRYAVLANGALKRLGADDLRPWRDALDAYLRNLYSA